MKKSYLLLTAAVAFGVGVSMANTALAQQTRPIDIPAQPLAEAITELGTETGLRIAADANAVAGKQSAAVSGPMTPKAALQQLLKGTGLSVRPVGEDGAVVSQNIVSQDLTEEPFDLGTLVVRGERRERDVFSTASSVRVFSGDEIEDDVQNTEYERVIDGAANINAQGISNNTPVIRGVDSAGVGGAISGQLPRATVTVDGRAITADEFRYGITSVWDVESIEVFRGPQTTSFGANSIAGAIAIRTRDPEFSNEGSARLEVGSDARHLGALMVNRALSDSVALRFTLERQEEDGYINFPVAIPPGSAVETSELTTARLKLLWVPTEIPQLETKLTFTYTDFSRPQTQIVVGPDFRAQNSNNLDGFPGAFTGETRTIVHDIEYAFDNGVTLRNQLQFSTAEIARVTGNPAALELPLDSENLTNEFIVEYAPDGGALSGVFGLYYQDTKDDSDPASGILFDDDKESRGVFGEMTYLFGNSVDVTAGLRYQQNKQDRFARLDRGPFLPVVLDYDETFDEWLPRFGIGYEPHEDLRFSFQVSRGFNPGGIGGSFNRVIFFPAFGDPFFEFDEETVTNYEFAVRGRFFDQRLFIAANLFYSDFEGYQFAEPTVLPDNTVDTIISNAEGVETYGLEIEGQFQASDQLTLTGALGLLQTEVTAFDSSAVNLVGNALPRAPEVNATLGFNYAMTDRFDFGGQVRYTGGYFSDISNTQAFKVSDRTTVDLRASYEVSDTAEVYFYVNNVFDEISPLFLFNSGGRIAGVTTEPREFGFGLQATF